MGCRECVYLYTATRSVIVSVAACHCEERSSPPRACRGEAIPGGAEEGDCFASARLAMTDRGGSQRRMIT